MLNPHDFDQVGFCPATIQFVSAIARDGYATVNCAPLGTRFAVLGASSRAFEICGIYTSRAAALTSAEFDLYDEPFLLVDLAQPCELAFYDLANAATPQAPEWHTWPTTPNDVLRTVHELENTIRAASIINAQT